MTDAVVVGAGLAGSLTAVYLARRGWRVRVLERRADPRTPGAREEGRSINLGLSQRGIVALREVGLLDALAPATVPMRGRVVHSPDGALRFQPYGTGEDQILHSVLRHDLNVALVDEAERRGVEFRWGHRVTAVDRQRPSVTTDGPQGTVEHTARLVVGADGAFSAVRAGLARGARTTLHQEHLEWGYKELLIPVGDDGRPRTELRALHVWPGDDGLIVAHPNVDGSLTATVFLPFEGREGFAGLGTGARVREFFARRFPDALTLVPDLVEQFLAHPPASLVTIRTEPWHATAPHGRGVVLLGDAAHAVYPFFGQGMNAAFEDCSVLDRCLAAHPHDLPGALAAFEAARRPHTDVLAELSKRNFVELRDRLRSPLFLARKKADLVLHRMFPRSWVPLYTLIAHTTVPYGEALARARRQDRLLGGVTAALTGAALAGLAHRSRRTRGRRQVS
ncbi:FAD-dependent oxidoreductase [Saccharothrix algeriensis]|uniref:FAD-dependent monooxygenase n=1 Tax=Saccharothrix algeriensis TaxID=173560 RepID=A0A8T8HZ96_9PSEU|nr:NAD(P)/FAD-dependent oxidoreductase [Saccharothrix algeriensis]MBM7809362.1 kynurenine 3-monooxygenase [Saccharothrix algeriensis]QTR03709.1 FAD-dependent monooxygenase [Saccharothrix algeriensis]